VKTRVLDSWAILEWIAGRQPAAAAVAALLSEAEDDHATLLMSAINAGEVYYCLRKNHSLEFS
jgi:predicted nucleic acid-binding protein